MLLVLTIFTGFAAVWAGAGVLAWHGRGMQLNTIAVFFRLMGNKVDDAHIASRTARLCWAVGLVFALVPPVLVLVQGQPAWLYLLAAVYLLLGTGGVVMWRRLKE